MRSILSVAASAWFAFNALTFLPPAGVYANPGQAGGLDGDLGAVAITWAARALFAGLALLALALVEWRQLRDFYTWVDSRTTRQRPGGR